MRHLIPEDRIWRLVDAKGQILGRMAVQIAQILQGVHKPYGLDNMFCGDPVIVINADKFMVSGRKRTNKLYIRHSGYPGGLKKVPLPDMLAKRPLEPVRRAVYNMLPRNKLRAVLMDNLHLYTEDDHPHHAQSPEPTAPAHLNARLRSGGPPSASEFDAWWTEHLLTVSDQNLETFVTDVRTARSQSRQTRGLADILAPSPNEDAELQDYVVAADKTLDKDPIIFPSTEHA